MLELRSFETHLDQFASLIRRSHCSQLFVVLSGARGVVSGAHDIFFADTGLLQRNLLILRDLGGGFYVDSLSPTIRGLDGLVGWVDGLRKGLGVEPDEAYVIGNSMGAYGSLLLGHYLGAAAVWAFAPTRTTTGSTHESAQVGLELDLEKALKEHNGKTRFNVLFNSSHQSDNTVATQLGKLPGEDLFPQPGQGHGVLAQFLTAGHGRTLIPPFRGVIANQVVEQHVDGRSRLLAFLALLTGQSVESIREAPLDLDSLGMVQVIDFAETNFGVRLPPATASLLHDGMFEDLWECIEASPVSELKAEVSLAATPPTTGRGAVPGRLVDGCLITDVEVGMPLTGRNNMAEGPLLKLLGDLRWRHAAQLTGIPSAETSDDEGNRLYATFYFVECIVPGPLGLAALGENDRFSVLSTLHRFGSSMLEGQHVLAPTGTVEIGAEPFDLPVIRMSNSFVRQWEGAGWLKKSRPAGAGFSRIPEIGAPPEAYRLLKASQNGDALLTVPAEARPLIAQASVVNLPIEPERDLNGAGLLYFANYPVFLDIAERIVLRDLGFDEGLLSRRSLLHRRSAYLSNASGDDALQITLRPWLSIQAGGLAAAGSIRLHVDFTMSRKSDGRQMMISPVSKTFTEITSQDIEAVTRTISLD